MLSCPGDSRRRTGICRTGIVAAACSRDTSLSGGIALRKGFEQEEGDEVPLSGVLAEFRIALREEIAAASHEARASAVALVNGHRLAQVAGGWQYKFQIESPLNMPGDTPGDLQLPNRAPIEVTVISVEALTIVLSVPEDLGAFVPRANLRSDLTFLMRRLIKRIEALDKTPNPTGDRILGKVPVSGVPAQVDLPELTPDKRKAIASALGRDITFIWGPPGTGKTTAIGAIGQELHQRKRSVLLVSHTNIAVDEALLRIGPTLTTDELARGHAIRVGEPLDPRLRDHNPELLLQTHVDRREAELAERLEDLGAERQSSIERTAELSRSIDICEWVAIARGDLDVASGELADVQRLESELDRTREERAHLEGETDSWQNAAEAAREIKDAMSRRETLTERARELSKTVSGLETDKTRAVARLARDEELLAEARRLAPLRARARELPPPEVQVQRVSSASQDLRRAQEAYAEVETRLVEAEGLYERTSSCGGLLRMWRRLPTPAQQREVVTQLQSEAASAREEIETTELWLADAEATLSDIRDLHEKLAPYATVPDADAQGQVVDTHRQEAEDVSDRLLEAQQMLSEDEAEIEELSRRIGAFMDEYAEHPDEVLRKASAHAEEVARLWEHSQHLARQSASRRHKLEEDIRRWLEVLREWRLTSESPGTAEGMLSAVRTARKAAVDEIGGSDIGELRAERDRLNERLRTIEAEIRSIEEAQKRVAELVIADAKVVATTLTQTYLRDAIQSRRFDTVVLDEASIAPIPALWVAASLADRNAVVVGDFKQLPPIVMSRHKLAEKWLGRDIFEEAQLSSYSADVGHFVPLLQQFRMHPDISAVPNALFYDHMLSDGAGTRSDGELADWYNGHEDAVILVDTGPVNAWVTSVPRGRGTSRLNFLSATVCVDVAAQLLSPNRKKWSPDGRPRILIVCPYRAHAALVKLLLDEQGILGEVSTGTVHNVQGSEAAVVIFDLVNDEPHWRVGMCMAERDKQNRRLLNVALTRARRRLIVVGDFDYIAGLSKHAFLCAELVPFLRGRYPCRNALDVVPTGLAARAAAAVSGVVKGDIAPDAARLVVSQEDFFALLRRDLDQAKRQIVIYSPFMTQHRLGWLESHLRAAVERGVQVCTVTRALSDRKKRELSEYRMLEKALKQWGVRVLHKQRMHEKLVFIDDEVLWSGSLNPLSFSDTQEIMERRASRTVSRDYARKLRLDKLLASGADGRGSCEVCNGEMTVAEGRRDLYWVCASADCGYARNLDAVPAQGGIVTCMCGGSFEYGQWGGNPAWRCTRDRRHRQKVRRAHLFLPRMRALLPRAELRKLDERFGIRRADQGPADQLDLLSE